MSSIKFSDIGIVTIGTSPNDLELFKRDENGVGPAWTSIDNGDVIDNLTGSITYNTNLTLTEFGQFTVSNNKAKGWIGVFSTAWDNPFNWGSGIVPLEIDDVIIPANTTYQPIVNINTSIRSLILQEGANIMVETGKVFEVKD